MYIFYYKEKNERVTDQYFKKTKGQLVVKILWLLVCLYASKAFEKLNSSIGGPSILSKQSRFCTCKRLLIFSFVLIRFVALKSYTLRKQHLPLQANISSSLQQQWLVLSHQ